MYHFLNTIFRIYVIFSFSDGIIPEKALDDRRYYQNMNEIVRFFKNDVTRSEDLSYRFKEFLASNYSENIFCGVSFFFLKLRNDLKILYFEE